MCRCRCLLLYVRSVLDFLGFGLAAEAFWGGFRDVSRVSMQGPTGPRTALALRLRRFISLQTTSDGSTRPLLQHANVVQPVFFKNARAFSSSSSRQVDTALFRLWRTKLPRTSPRRPEFLNCTCRTTTCKWPCAWQMHQGCFPGPFLGLPGFQEALRNPRSGAPRRTYIPQCAALEG